MNRRATILVSGIFALLALGLIAQGIRVSRLQNDLIQTRSRLDQIDARQKAVPGTATVEEVREEIARVERKIDARPVAPAGAGTAVPPDAIPTYLTEEEIAQIVEEKVREQAEADPKKNSEEQGAFGERKLPLANIAEDLELDLGTEALVAEIANVSKKEMFDILKTLRADGSNLADDLVNGFLAGDENILKEIFGKIFTDVLPGSNTTYLAAMGEAQQRAHRSLEETLGPERYLRFKHMNVDPNDIQTGYDPFEEYMQQRGQ